MEHRIHPLPILKTHKFITVRISTQFSDEIILICSLLYSSKEIIIPELVKSSEWHLWIGALYITSNKYGTTIKHRIRPLRILKIL